MAAADASSPAAAGAAATAGAGTGAVASAPSFADDVKYIDDVNGIRIAYIETGAPDPDAPAGAPERKLVVLVHGYPDTARTWTDLMPRLAAKGYWAVAYFQRGYHPSGFPADGDYNALRLGEDVLGVIRGLGRERAILVGHDWGASAVYNAAEMSPESVERMVAVAIPHPATIAPGLGTIWRARHFITYKLPWAVSTVRGNNFAHVKEIYNRWSPTWDVPDSELTDVKRAFAEPEGVEHALGYYWSAGPPNDEQKAVYRKRCHVKTLAIGGIQDGATAVELFDHTHRQFKK